MRRTVTAVLATALCVMLCSCGKGVGAEEKALQIRALLIKARNIEMTADITADYGDSVYEFKIGFSGTALEGEITVLEPESVEGLRIEIKNGASVVGAGDAELYMGELDSDGLSPADAVPALLQAWSGGYVRQAYYTTIDNEETVVIETGALSSKVTSTGRFNPDTGFPSSAEIACEGYTVIYCDINEFSVG